MFVNYAYSDEFMIPPTDLRRALSMQFAGEARFQIGEMVSDQAPSASVHTRPSSLTHSALLSPLYALKMQYDATETLVQCLPVSTILCMCTHAHRELANALTLSAYCLQVAVLGYLHSVFIGVGEKDDEPCEPLCLVHQVFSMNFCDRVGNRCILVDLWGQRTLTHHYSNHSYTDGVSVWGYLRACSVVYFYLSRLCD
jgi:hypothetical protein